MVCINTILKIRGISGIGFAQKIPASRTEDHFQANRSDTWLAGKSLCMDHV